MLQLVAGDFSPKVEMQQTKSFNDLLYFDDSHNVVSLQHTSVRVSYDDGFTWTTVNVMKGTEVQSLMFDQHVKERAFAFGTGQTHFFTNDKGKTWRKFTASGLKLEASLTRVVVTPNAADPNLLLFNFLVCDDWFYNPLSCRSHIYYSTNGLLSDPKLLTDDAVSCTFALATKQFAKIDKKETILCSRIKTNSFGHVLESSLVKTTDFFKTSTSIDHPALKSGKIIELSVHQSFIVAVVQSDRFNTRSQVSILISTNGEDFQLSNLDFEVSSGAIKFLDSSPLSLFISVGQGSREGHILRSTLYSSDSTGLRWTSLLENVAFGSTTKVENVDGVWIANTLSDNPDGDDESLMDDFFGSRNYKPSSKISIDDGKTWRELAVVDDDSCKVEDGCSLHVIGVNSFEAEGKYLTGPTPNILVASGTTGSHLGIFNSFKTYVSRDGGISWKLVLHQGTLASTADHGNIIVALPYSGRKGSPAEKLLYSLDQGKTWSDHKLEKAIYPIQFVTTLDGSGKKFILTGMIQDDVSMSYEQILYTIDFSDAFGGAKCDKDKDFEKVYARVAEGDSSPLCVYGHTESFMRRKQDSKCLVDALFEDIKVNEDPCKCTDEDFECSPYFKLSPKGECVPDQVKVRELCQKSKKATVKVENKQLAAGNLCKSDKLSFITTEELNCENFGEDLNNLSRISSSLSSLDGTLAQYAYVETDRELADNIIVSTKEGIVYASNNGGNTFVRVPVTEKVYGFVVGPVEGVVILITAGETFYYSKDGGNTFRKLKAPGPAASRVRPVSYHPEDSSQFIWFLGDCGHPDSKDCSAYYTTDSGSSFSKLIDDAVACNYVSSIFGLSALELIYCTIEGANHKKLVSSANYFKENEPKVLFDNIASYAIRSKFVIVATVDTELHELRAKVTMDGTTFADADFPSDFKVEAQTSYAILDSGSQSIFMHVTTNSDSGRERGSILKSNSNGTSYVLSLNDVNRNPVGDVDYDRMEGIEGVLIANTVNNPESGDLKKLKSQISFNDGSQWSFLPPPSVDSEGKKFPCVGQSLSKCSLNLHGFTERPDFRDTFSSASAIGVLIGVGNVGETLESYEKASTFLSTDGGLSWREIRKGVHQWEFGDQGTILVLVNAVEKTNEIVYSTDEGASWQTFKFAEKPVTLLDLATIPTDTSRKFVIFAKSDVKGDEFSAYSIDFTHFFARQCELDLDSSSVGDYEYWTPKHPESSEGCLFGHEAKFLRRAQGHNDCFIGSAPLDKAYKVVRNCTCTRNDYECDYNYYRDTDGTCKLVKGLTPADRKASMCSKPDTFQYFEPTGYRKIPLSTCVGGKSFDAFNPRPCPGHEKEFSEHYGTDVGGGKILVIILLPLFVFFAATWFVYERGIRRNGGFLQFGQIRLDEDDDFNPIEENTVDVVVNRIVRGGIILVAGTIAVLKTVRKIDKALMERVTATIFGRRPGRRNYVRVPDDEDELFGDFENDYEDELEEGADVNFDVQEDAEDFTDFSEQPADTDARLFDIDEHSDDGSREANADS